MSLRVTDTAMRSLSEGGLTHRERPHGAGSCMPGAVSRRRTDPPFLMMAPCFRSSSLLTEQSFFKRETALAGRPGGRLGGESRMTKSSLRSLSCFMNYNHPLPDISIFWCQIPHSACKFQDALAARGNYLIIAYPVLRLSFLPFAPY